MHLEIYWEFIQSVVIPKAGNAVKIILKLAAFIQGLVDGTTSNYSEWLIYR